MSERLAERRPTPDQFLDSAPDVLRDAPITGVRAVPSDPNLRIVAVADQTVATLPVAEIERLGLEEGQTWNAGLAERVHRAVQAAAARRRALQVLGRRALSRSELILALEKHEHARDIAEEVVDELARNGWIDDASFAAAYCHALLSRGPLARRRLTEKLMARGLDGSLAERASRESLSDAQELEAARALLRQRLARFDSPPPAAAKRRAAAALSRRGFEVDTIAQVMRENGLLEPHEDR